MLSKRKIIPLLLAIFVIAISASIVHSYTTTKDVMNNPGLRVSTTYTINDTGNATLITDPKTQKYISIKNTGTFDADYNICKDITDDFNAEKVKPSPYFNQSTLESYKANISEIKISNGLEMYRGDDGGMMHEKYTIYKVNGKTGVVSNYTYPTIKNDIFFKELVIN